MKKALLILLTLLILPIVMVSCDNSVDYPFDDDVPAVETPEMVPLTFEFIKDGKIIITNKPDNMKFTRNSGAKQDVPENGVINAEGGDRIKLFATRTSAESGNFLNIKCTSTDICYVYGNVMSLILEEGFADKKDVFKNAFRDLFKGNETINLHDSKKLVLPATTLAFGCYNRMFADCISLKKAPELPAITLADYCYEEMFSGCTSLKSAPALPAESLTKECYAYMFDNCSSLTSAPELPAMNLATSCYQRMFGKCTSLTTAPKLPANTLASKCYNGMFSECTSLTTAPELLATTLVDNCYSNMFNGCSSLNYIKCLATNPGSNYTNDWVVGVAKGGLFIKDDSVTMDTWTIGNNGIPETWYCDPNYVPLTLEFIKSGKITISNPPAVFYYTINYGDKQTLPDTKVIDVKAGDKVCFYAVIDSDYYKRFKIKPDSDCYIYGNIMSLVGLENIQTLKVIPCEYAFIELFFRNSFIENHSIKQLVLPATTLTNYCYMRMFADCPRLSIAPDLPAMTLANNCYHEMFMDCSSLTKVPATLPATTLAPYCYYAMFMGCSSLKTTPVLPASTLVESCYWNIFRDTSCNIITCYANSGFSADSCLRVWVSNVSPTGTFYKRAGVDWPTGESGIPEGWTVVEIAP